MLLGAKYILQHKFFENNKPKTEYEVSALGKSRFNSYLEVLKQILSQSTASS
jgi:hypothetical protein